VFPIAFMLSGKDLFQLLCLLFFCNPLIHRRGIVAYGKLLAATVTIERARFLQTLRFLSALTRSEMLIRSWR